MYYDVLNEMLEEDDELFEIIERLAEKKEEYALTPYTFGELITKVQNYNRNMRELGFDKSEPPQPKTEMQGICARLECYRLNKKIEVTEFLESIIEGVETTRREQINQRKELAANLTNPIGCENDSVRVFYKLAGDVETGVREAIAKNPNCPTELLEQLAKDERKSVRFIVAANPSTPTEVLEKFAKTKKYGVNVQHLAQMKLQERKHEC